MIIGIESTAHTFGVGIVEKGKILVNVKDSYTTETGGIIPTDAAKHHKNVSERVWKEAIEKAQIEERQILAIAISQAPGLSPCLIEGMKFAKLKAMELKIPLVGVNHCVSHLEIGRITGATDPVLLYASGANTQIIAYESGRYRIFGETLDIGIGNFIDNFARIIGMGFPGGPKVEIIARDGKYIELPYSIKGMDIAFSGILTNLKQKYKNGLKKEDLAYSLQETVFSMLVEASERALAHTNKKELVLGGGVGCNKRLKEMCRIMCEERGAKFFCPPNDLLTDNGAMIAYLGEIMFKHNIFIPLKEIDSLDINARQRTDEVNVNWR